VKVLDHGYVSLVETWGSDERIIEAARMSTSGSFKGWGKHCKKCNEPLEPKGIIMYGCGYQLLTDRCNHEWVEGDEKLLRFLYTNKHMSPFEMAGMVIEVQAPIFVFREWHRHRTMSYNELSGRYTELPDLFYIPSEERIMAGKQSTKNKQGSEDSDWEALQAWALTEDIDAACHESRKVYEYLLKIGLSRELARLVIPVNQYSRMRASANLRNWLQFLELRLPEGAQWEIRQYAKAVAEIVAEKFPRTFELFKEDKTWK